MLPEIVQDITYPSDPPAASKVSLIRPLVMSRDYPSQANRRKDTQERSENRGRRQSSLLSKLLNIQMGNFLGVFQVIEASDEIADQNWSDRLLHQAPFYHNSDRKVMAQTCIHHALLIQKYYNIGETKTWEFCQRLSQDKEEADDFLREVNAVYTRRFPPVDSRHGGDIFDEDRHRRPSQSGPVQQGRRGSALAREDQTARPSQDPVYFLPAEDIDFDVITRDITKYVGQSARVRLGKKDVRLR